MSLHRFFVNKIANNSATIFGEDYNHAVQVLRLAAKDQVLVFNYEHGEFLAEITAISPPTRTIDLSILKQTKECDTSKAVITAIIALIKKDKMEFVLEKLTELGVDVIIPLITNRTIIKIKDEEKKEKRWQSIIYTAVKQCGRISTPKLLPVVSGVNALAIDDAVTKFFVYEKEKEHYLIDEAVKLPPDAKACFIIGPEGGFDNSEAQCILDKGFIPVSIGNTTLRAETAAIASATVLVQALRRGN